MDLGIWVWEKANLTKHNQKKKKEKKKEGSKKSWVFWE